MVYSLANEGGGYDVDESGTAIAAGVMIGC